VNVTVPIYQRRGGGSYDWITLGLGPFTLRRRSTNAAKLQEKLIDDLRRALEAANAENLRHFDLKKGTYLRRVRIEVSTSLDGKKARVSGLCPLVIEPRMASDERMLNVVYHPHRQEDWFVWNPIDPLETQANAFFNHAFRKLGEEAVQDLLSEGKDLVRVLAFSARPRTLLDVVAEEKRGPWDDLRNDPAQKKARASRSLKVLGTLGIDRTSRANGDGEGLGMPRVPYREQIAMLLGGTSHRARRSTLVVGAPGSGKSTILARFVDDLLIAEDFPSHRNYDKVTHVWEIQGKRIIAGMSYLGEWEQRVSDLIEDVRGKKIILYVPDIHAFGRIGQARDSTRALADVLKSPVARGDVIIVGECTEEQLARLEQDAPTFAALFSRVHLRETSPDEAFQMLLAAARDVEARTPLTFHLLALRTLLELGSALVAHRVLPGKALELLHHLVASREASGTYGEIGPDEVIDFLAKRTGLPSRLLSREKPLERREVEEDLSARVIGQPNAVRAAADLVMRIRAGICDPRRPYGVYLFTGPTGTGKTELAKALAVELYGSEDRLLRFDMGELGGPDAASRLVGDAFDPDGTLTRALREQPFCVVLFDEVEKAHPTVLNLFLQLFEDGRLTDAAGNVASFAHAVVIMTSNLGARSTAALGFGAAGSAEQARVRDAIATDVAKAVREFFPPELFNRIDRVVSFSPLSHEVAIDVAQKELGKLLARRGLASRQIFVQANRAVVERVATDAFQQRDGARSLKRFIEERVGTILGEEIARAPAAALRVMQIFAQPDLDAPFRVVQEALHEATPHGARSILEGLLEASVEQLQPYVRALLPRVEAIEDGPELAEIAASIRERLARRANEGVLHLDALRARVPAARERLEALLISSRERDREDLEVRHTRYDVVETGTGWDFRRDRVRMRAGSGNARTATTPRDLLAVMAEVQFLENALRKSNDDARHSVNVEVVPLAPWSHALGGFTKPLLVSYLGLLQTSAIDVSRGEVEDISLLHEDGTIEDRKGASSLRALLEGPSKSESSTKIVHFAFRATGPCVLDLLGDETGTHVFEPLAGAPDLVRVRVSSAVATPRDLSREHQTRRDAFARATASSDGAPDPVFPSLPIVRRIRYPGTNLRAPTPWSIEDYRAAYAESVVAKTLEIALWPLFALRLARVETE